MKIYKGKSIMNGKAFFWKCVIGILLGLILFGLVTQLLWNWLIPDLFNGPRITYVQAIGLLALSKLLTWGFWGRPPRHSGQPYWKRRFAEKLHSMDPQEREAFKQKMKEKWCSWEKDSSASGSSNV